LGETPSSRAVGFPKFSFGGLIVALGRVVFLSKTALCLRYDLEREPSRFA
jgi:hypothetical protein